MVHALRHFVREDTMQTNRFPSFNLIFSLFSTIFNAKKRVSRQIRDGKWQNGE
jgi:hypothetical protein